MPYFCPSKLSRQMYYVSDLPCFAKNNIVHTKKESIIRNFLLLFIKLNKQFIYSFPICFKRGLLKRAKFLWPKSAQITINDNIELGCYLLYKHQPRPEIDWRDFMVDTCIWQKTKLNFQMKTKQKLGSLRACDECINHFYGRLLLSIWLLTTNRCGFGSVFPFSVFFFNHDAFLFLYHSNLQQHKYQ